MNNENETIVFGVMPDAFCVSILNELFRNES